MELQTAQRKRAKIKMAIQGHSGSGKTYSALLVAHGLCQSWEKVAVIDTCLLYTSPSPRDCS